MKKEKKQLRYPGLKAGSIYGTMIFFRLYNICSG